MSPLTRYFISIPFVGALVLYSVIAGHTIAGIASLIIASIIGYELLKQTMLPLLVRK